ncbi:hypothetical protein LXL04_006944 [Taraxacum kok-saghyz]
MAEAWLVRNAWFARAVEGCGRLNNYEDEEQFINALREGSDKYTRGAGFERLALEFSELVVYKTPFSTRIKKYSSISVVDEKRTRYTLWVHDSLLRSHGKHPAICRSRCLGAILLEMPGVATGIGGPAGACVVGRDWFSWCPLVVSGGMPLLLATRAIEFSACTEMVKVALVAFWERTPILLLLRRNIDTQASFPARTQLKDDELGCSVMMILNERWALRIENVRKGLKVPSLELILQRYGKWRMLMALETWYDWLSFVDQAGPKRFTQIRDEMKNEDPNHEFPTLTQMFERTRKRTDERIYVDTYDNTARKLNYKPLEHESDVVDPYMVVMNKEHDGYRHLYGRGVTNRLIKKVGGGDTSYMIPEALMESFKANEVERNQLIEMKKEIQEDHEKQNAELEAMQIDINNQ